MDKKLSSAFMSEQAQSIIRELHEDSARHEQLTQKVIAFIRQHVLMEPCNPWIPLRHNNAADVQMHLNTRKIKASHTKSSRRNVYLRNFYRHYLKRYALVRSTIQWTFRNGYPVYINLLYKVSYTVKKRWRRLVKLNDFSRENQLPAYKLADATIIEASIPLVFPASDQYHLISPHSDDIFPEVFVAVIKHAVINGGTNLIQANGQVICHDLYDFARDYTSEEAHRRTIIDSKLNRIRCLVQDCQPASVPVAASFVDACAANYAHWMTEVLPRIAMFCREERFKDIPIVINDGLHENIMESLFLVVGAEREIFILPIGRALNVDELYLTSATGYVPFDRRSTKLSNHSHGMFSSVAIKCLKDSISITVSDNDNSVAEKNWPQKVFLRRNSGTRKISNIAEIEEYVLSKGYVPVETEKLTFTEQVLLFKNAKTIVSATGAALANAIFCEPGTNVAILMGKHKNMIYRYWSNMLMPFGIKVGYVLGNIVANRDLGIHGDFAIETDDLVELLKTMESQ